MKVLILRFEAFPYESASAFRCLTLVKLLCHAGHQVSLIVPQINDNHNEGKNCILNEINMMDVSTYTKSKKNQYENCLEDYLSSNEVDVVIRPTSIHHFHRIQKILSKNNIPTVMDSVEWYGPSNWRLQYLDPRYYYFCYLWQKEFSKAQGIIAISRLIEQHYLSFLNNVVRIPTITDCSDTPYRVDIRESKCIYFIFAGRLDKNKDRLTEFIVALDHLGERGKNVFLDVYGPDTVELEEQLGDQAYLLNKHQKTIRIHGKVKQEIVKQKCYESDFSVFFRPDRRSSNAGFPTKLGECMTCGTPAFCNDTGDISLVLEDNINGFLIKDLSVEEIYEKLELILTMELEERKKMRLMARKKAEEYFNYYNYAAEINSVLINAATK